MKNTFRAVILMVILNLIVCFNLLAAESDKFDGGKIKGLQPDSTTSVEVGGSKPPKPFKKIAKVAIEERLRFENRTYPFFDAKKAGKSNYGVNRFRYSVEESLNPDFKMNITWQDYRFFSRDPVSDPATSRTDFDVYNANFAFDKFFGCDELKLTLGRQEFFYGNERVFGKGNWTAGRAWDGAKFSYKTKSGTFDIFDLELKRAEVNPPVQVRGLYYLSDAIKGLEIYLVKKVDRNTTAGEIVKTKTNRDINTYGFNYTKKYNKRWESNSEAAFQTGSWGPDSHAAYAFHQEVRYNTLSKMKHSIILEYNQAAGDDDPADGEHKTFDNLYPMNHQKYGYMDYVSWQNMRELCLRNIFTVCKGVEVKLNFHKFELDSSKDSWYDSSQKAITARRDVTGAAGTDLGREVDLVLTKKLKNNFTIEAGTSKFYAGDFIKRTNPANTTAKDPAWTYLQILKKW